MIIDGTFLTKRDDVTTDPYVYAYGKHLGATYGDGPYIRHVEEVFGIVYEHLKEVMECDPFEDHGSCHVMLIAALLHDVVEDCFEDREVGMAEVTELFGFAVGTLVEYLTDPDGETRELRKHKFLAKMSGILSGSDPRFEALVVKYADRIANFRRSIADDDTRRIKMYLKEMPDFLYLSRSVKFYPMIRPLYHELCDLREDAYDIVGRY